MGQNSILTTHQRWFLDQVNHNKYICSQYYFTGGTTLSEFYLHHRYSDDLDFFSQKNIDQPVIFSFIEKFCAQYNGTFESEFIEVVYRFNLHFPHTFDLKIDFSFDPSQRIKKGMIYGNIQVDSLLDIAINKIVTVSQRINVKDFVDLYFLLKKFSTWDLIEGARVKHRIKIEPFILASDLLTVDTFETLPRMIIPLTLSELKKYFRNKAKELGLKKVEK